MTKLSFANGNVDSRFSESALHWKEALSSSLIRLVR